LKLKGRHFTCFHVTFRFPGAQVLQRSGCTCTFGILIYFYCTCKQLQYEYFMGADEFWLRS